MEVSTKPITASPWSARERNGNPLVKCVLRGLLGIPEKLEIYDMLVLGYPAYEPKPRLVRERVEMVHYGRYGKARYRGDEEIRNFIVGLRKG